MSDLTLGDYAIRLTGLQIERDSQDALIAALLARVAELEQALRLHLAVAPDDPVLLTPIERQLAESQQRVQKLEIALRRLVPITDGLIAYKGRMEGSWNYNPKQDRDVTKLAQQALEEVDDE